MTTTIKAGVTCRRCGRPLNSAPSRAFGIGPGCSRVLHPATLEALAATAARTTGQMPLEFGDDGRAAA
ncbi:DUF6011 domain-containing protein [Frankia sp. QA3]|uniref:DUF6011 domain-containing protein n=1 Tax=Frankia sp. QA3 TaxID=710111 RepID=UPI000315F348|nr:DUF6011 domain-containing protein [Frankia sp. QA3]